jgi:hypothetical protein
MKKLLPFTLLFWTISKGVAQNNFEKFYIGTHRLTLQWLDNVPSGKAVVTKNIDGQLEMKGEQRKGEKDFVTIDGIITPTGEREFKFSGTIITCANYINNGQPCEKKGNYTFKATGKRKYWRLQQMDNCEGNSVVDYVDIFFLKM